MSKAFLQPQLGKPTGSNAGSSEPSDLAPHRVDLADDAVFAPPVWRRVLFRVAQPLYVIVTFVIAVGVWQLVVTVFDVSQIILPSPGEVAHAIARGRSVIPHELAWTLSATAVGFCIALVAGIVLALLVSEIKLLRKTLYPLIVGFQSMPHIGMAPLFIVWFGFGTLSHSVLAGVVAFFPVFSNATHGFDSVQGERVRLFRSYRASRLQTIWRLKLPMALPFLFAGANIGIIFAMLGVIVAEFLGSNTGMGFLLVQEGNSLDTAGVFAVLVVLAVVGVLLHTTVLMLRRLLLRWV